MNREEFLKSHWDAYPDIRAEEDSFFYGRVCEVGEGFIQIRNQSHSMMVLEKELSNSASKNYGMAVPLCLLVVGDRVAFGKSLSTLYLLAPCLNPMEKPSQKDAADWSHFLESVASYFKGQEFLHLQTPNLVVSPGVDHHIDFFQVKGVTTGRQWCLPTSPEIHLKKFLCQGYDRIFEIKNCFRDDLIGEHHKVEFTMLEWYRAYVGLDQIIEDVDSLLNHLDPSIPSLTQMTVSQAFKKWAQFNLNPETTKNDLLALASNLNIEVATDDDWNDIFFRVFMEKIEPNLGFSGPMILSHYPRQQASLSKIDSQGWSSRFELYWQGVELANAYLEVNDPQENKKRFLHEQELRKKEQSTLAGWDEDYFSHLESGMPPPVALRWGWIGSTSCFKARDKVPPSTLHKMYQMAV